MKLLTTAIAIALAVGTVQAQETHYSSGITPSELALVKQCIDAVTANSPAGSYIYKVSTQRSDNLWDFIVYVNDPSQLKLFQASCMFKNGMPEAGSQVVTDAVRGAKEGTIRWYQPKTKSWVIDKVCYPGMEC